MFIDPHISQAGKQPVDTFLSVIQVLLADAWFSYMLRNATTRHQNRIVCKK